MQDILTHSPFTRHINTSTDARVHSFLLLKTNFHAKYAGEAYDFNQFYHIFKVLTAESAIAFICFDFLPVGEFK